MTPLRLHSDFSLLRSMIPVSGYAKTLKSKGYQGGAVTDFDCGFGWVDFSFQMEKAGLKPILGTHIFLEMKPGESQKGPLTLLVENADGYKNLCKILSTLSMKTLNMEKLLQWRKGLILLIAPTHPQLLIDNPVYETWDPESLFFEAYRYQAAPSEAPVREAAQKSKGRIVATQPVYYLSREDAFAQEVMMCIRDGYKIEDENHPRLPSQDFYLRSAEEMLQLFSDEPDWCQVSDEILSRVDFKFKTDTYYLPEIGEESEVDQLFEQECYKGLEQRLELVREKYPGEDFEKTKAEYERRLQYEIKVIKAMKFPAYFLIVADFIQWSKAQEIPVGPGRGSGAGSLAAYCLSITDIDPIQYNLLFERFLNPERVSLPDFDVDFCIKGRDRVIQYVRDKYNLNDEALATEERLKVAQIITYGKMKSKAVIRDVGRALGMSYQDVDAIAKLVPPVLNITLQEAYEAEPEFQALRERDPKANQLLNVADKLEGLNRHTSVHAAGVVIADKALSEYLPLYETGDNETVVQFEMKAAEKIGLVKFDFLGLRNLTVIKDCIELTGEEIDLLKIDYNDPRVLKEIGTGETTGIFQLESSGMRELIRRLKPSKFEDLVALVALYRPGPLEGGMVDDFILRKHGKKAVEYPVPALKDILEETYGVFVYQEQVMGTANIMAGFSLGEADMLRRAMGKKIAEEMAKQRVKFVEGSKAKGYEEGLSSKIFDLMAEFAKYGFNKSHAAAYAMITFQTAYLKTYYPEAFFAALLSSESEDIEKVGLIIRTAQKRGIHVLPPDVNASLKDFSLEKETNQSVSVRFGLGAVKNLGGNLAQAIVTEREARNVFESVEDFFHRVPASLLNKRQCETLIRSGSLDRLGESRATIFASLEQLTGSAQSADKARKVGQASLFQQKTRLKKMEEWPDRIRLNDEKSLLGTYMTGHPLQTYQAVLKSIDSVSLQKVLDRPVPPREKEVHVAGIISSKKEILTKKGTKMAFFTLEDEDASLEVVVFPDLFSRKADLVNTDRLITVRGQVVRENGSTRILARDLNVISKTDFDDLIVSLKDESMVESLEMLQKQAKMFEGSVSLKIRVPVKKQVFGKDLQESFVMINTPLKVKTSPQLLNWIESQFGEGSIQLR